MAGRSSNDESDQPRESTPDVAAASDLETRRQSPKRLKRTGEALVPDPNAPKRRKTKGKQPAEPDPSERRKKQGKEKRLTTTIIDEPENSESQYSDAGDDPFGEILVKWQAVRPDFLNPPLHRVQIRGKERLIGEIRRVLSSYGVEAILKVKASALGAFMRLDDENNRSGLAINYMVSRQVKPPDDRQDIDQTALWFKINGKIVRFSRVEYALVSGLKFGPSSFDPYDMQLKPPCNSLYERLIGSNPKLTPEELRLIFFRRAYMDADDAIKIAKLLLATHYIMGYECARNQIPVWMWVLLEETQAWEDFPWGSISYQALVTQINAVAKKRKKGSSRAYGFKGNSIAFLVSFVILTKLFLAVTP